MSRERASLRRLDRAEAGLALLALAMLLLRYGWPQVVPPRELVLGWSALLPLGLFAVSLGRLLVVRDPLRELRRHPLRYALLLVILLELSGLSGWSEGGAIQPSGVSVFAGEAYLLIALVGFAGSWAKGLLAANRWLANRDLPVLALPALGFGLAILGGSLLLSLPGLQRQPIPWIDSLFTATSALCVTGLTVYDVGSALSPAGQLLLALLIQLGGLGIITLLGLLALWRGGALSAKERVAFGALIGGLELRQTRHLLRRTAAVVIALETIGALALWLLWRDEQPHALLQAGFHAISAFCNAGFTLFADSCVGFAGDAGTLSVLVLLIVAGGIGTPVLAELAGWFTSRVLPWGAERRLSRASRVTLAISLGLIAVGSLAYWLDAALAGRAGSPLRALFQSATTRTAGFQVESQLGFGALGFWCTLALMAIGASAQSTGGGIKTNVIARLFLRLDAVSPGRRIAADALGIAALLCVGYLALGTLAGLLLSTLEGVAWRDALFECYSALGTVGLSRDLTPQLGPAGKWLLIALMFTGRVLYPTWVLRMAQRSRPGAEPVDWV